MTVLILQGLRLIQKPSQISRAVGNEVTVTEVSIDLVHDLETLF
jgi:hypothetical protein